MILLPLLATTQFAKPADVKQELTATYREFIKATSVGDVAEIEKFLSPDFKLSAGSRTLSKGEYLDSLKPTGKATVLKELKLDKIRKEGKYLLVFVVAALETQKGTHRIKVRQTTYDAWLGEATDRKLANRNVLSIDVFVDGKQIREKKPL